MNSLFGSVAAIGFLLALIVHIMTLASVDVFDRYPSAWMLHVGIFIVFIPFVLSVKVTHGTVKKFGDLFNDRPLWVYWLVRAVMIYAAVNFGLFFLLNGAGGTPDIRNGEFVLHSHGRIIRSITEAEYHLQNAYIARGFSGHWLVFYLIPALYFLIPPLRPRRD